MTSVYEINRFHPKFAIIVIKLKSSSFRACLHGGEGPLIGEVTFKFGGSPHLSCKRDQIKMRDYMNRRVTSNTWGPPPSCKQALNVV